jgi:hypothetical protein
MIRDDTPRWKACLELAAVIIEVIAVVFLVIYTTFAGLQWHEMHHALLVDQRAWVSFVPPSNFPFENSSVLASIQIANIGKTPAKKIAIDIIATVLKKGEEPSFDFSVGHPHSTVHIGVLFPNAPVPVTVQVVRYGPKTPEVILPSPELQQEIVNNESFIIFYGKIYYFDVFGVSHWTSFCAGSGSAMGDMKKCVDYNDVDSN